MTARGAAPPTLTALNEMIVACRRCPRLIAYCRAVAREKRRAFRDWEYWGKPVPGFGDPAARVLMVGLAPAAHGGNRTGRIFTGDSSGTTLMGALYRAGFASQPQSVARDDGLRLVDLYLAAAVRCAPPDNRPLPAEIARCRPYLVAELRLLRRLQVVVALGRIAHDAALDAARAAGAQIPRPRPAFAHGAEARLVWGARTLLLIASYHPSQQNTATGRLTPAMLDAVFRRVRAALSS
ncbi:MAG: uracil-DNA glycosylase [Armatimonadota bacterium]|nr:uracil-DNA glycosylase [Armatimonadota bacterium]MDR7486947.1 uracil-DNA glycosylase [Armatimonadota bacterium]MDR7533538.1 uracil-DNA glycosylase [Armatimonadota bacterium]MDR7536872.1 uracil-DNA glycosylase [Armatimonadota bacterium]